jgi:hypothetical protein
MDAASRDFEDGRVRRRHAAGRRGIAKATPIRRRGTTTNAVIGRKQWMSWMSARTIAHPIQIESVTGSLCRRSNPSRYTVAVPQPKYARARRAYIARVSKFAKIWVRFILERAEKLRNARKSRHKN